MARIIFPMVSKKSLDPLFFFGFPENVLFTFSVISLAPSFIFSDASFAKQTHFLKHY